MSSQQPPDLASTSTAKLGLELPTTPDNLDHRPGPLLNPPFNPAGRRQSSPLPAGNRTSASFVPEKSQTGFSAAPDEPILTPPGLVDVGPPMAHPTPITPAMPFNKSPHRGSVLSSPLSAGGQIGFAKPMSPYTPPATPPDHPGPGSLTRKGSKTAMGIVTFRDLILSGDYARFLDAIKLSHVEPKDLKGPMLDGTTLLHTACTVGNLDIVKYLVEEARLEVEPTPPSDNQLDATRSPLMCAISSGHLPVVTYLTRKGANVQAVDHWGNHPLTLAATSGYLSIVKHLVIDAGVDPHMQHGKTEATAAAMAEERGFKEVVEFLVASPGAGDHRKEVALNRAFAAFMWIVGGVLTLLWSLASTGPLPYLLPASLYFSIFGGYLWYANRLTFQFTTSFLRSQAGFLAILTVRAPLIWIIAQAAGGQGAMETLIPALAVWLMTLQGAMLLVVSDEWLDTRFMRFTLYGWIVFWCLNAVLDTVLTLTYYPVILASAGDETLYLFVTPIFLTGSLYAATWMAWSGARKLMYWDRFVWSSHADIVRRSVAATLIHTPESRANSMSRDDPPEATLMKPAHMAEAPATEIIIEQPKSTLVDMMMKHAQNEYVDFDSDAATSDGRRRASAPVIITSAPPTPLVIAAGGEVAAVAGRGTLTRASRSQYAIALESLGQGTLVHYDSDDDRSKGSRRSPRGGPESAEALAKADAEKNQTPPLNADFFRPPAPPAPSLGGTTAHDPDRPSKPPPKGPPPVPLRTPAPSVGSRASPPVPESPLSPSTERAHKRLSTLAEPLGLPPLSPTTEPRKAFARPATPPKVPGRAPTTSPPPTPSSVTPSTPPTTVGTTSGTSSGS